MKAKTIPTFSFLLLMLLVQFAPAQKLELVVQTGHSGSVNSVAYSPDGKLLASGGSDGVIKLWHVPTGSELRALSGHADAVRSVAFSPDGKVIASGSAERIGTRAAFGETRVIAIVRSSTFSTADQ